MLISLGILQRRFLEIHPKIGLSLTLTGGLLLPALHFLRSLLLSAYAVRILDAPMFILLATLFRRIQLLLAALLLENPP